MPSLFNKKILQQRVKNYTVENIEEKIERIKNWQKNLQSIKGLNEKRLQAAFLGAIFENILGYENTPQKNEWTMEIECSTDLDATTPDGILGFYIRDNGEQKDHQAVIELKGPQVPLDKDQKRKKTTYKSPVDQGFSYTNKLDKCRWVIISNFTEIRLYQVGRSKEYYEIFYLNELDDVNEFKKFHYLLCKKNLISRDGKSQTLQLTEVTQKRDEDISVEFYNLYKNVRINLFEHLKENNNLDHEVLLEKAQKFLDRIIFICFCEDKGLLPNDLLHNAIQQAKNSFAVTETAVWSEIKGVFRAIDKGMPNKDINAYNGGLFEYDEILDSLTIQDDLFSVIYEISDYDFDSDVDVNILGHIFEQSISDIEKLKSDIKENEFDKNQSRRKKEGIYYTPQYITSYIVENAVGGYLEDRKEDMGYYDLPDIEKAGSDSWQTRYTNQHLNFYNKYEEKLKNIKILDPACGSGAFLNQAFDYLLKEHQWLNKQRDILRGCQSSIYALEAVQRNILRNNLYGVDLNEESVEITKLSLWLKTANKNKPLTNLDDNIKCGNSLISDPGVAGDKAFIWEDEFSKIMDDGGFDIVIGNPPYVRHENIKWMKPYLKENYEVYHGTADLYCYFFERGMKLLKRKGYFSFIVSNKFTRNNYGNKLRKYLSQFKIKRYIDYNEKIFEDVSVDPCTIIVKKQFSHKEHKFLYNENNQILQKHLNSEQGWVFLSWKELKIKEKLEKRGKQLKEWDLNIYRGITTGFNKAFIINNEEREDILSKCKNVEERKRTDKIINKLLRGKDIKRYYFIWNGLWIISAFPSKNIDINNYPSLNQYLNSFRKSLKQSGEPGARKKTPHKWFEIQDTTDYYGEFEKNKIIFTKASKKQAFAFDTQKTFLSNTCYIMTGENLKFILMILNSLLAKYAFTRFYSGGGITNEITVQGIIKLPIPDLKNISLTKLEIYKKKSKNMIEMNVKLQKLKYTSFLDVMEQFTSNRGVKLYTIITPIFSNQIYSGRASKITDLTVNINTNIMTLYSDKSSSGKYELLKFEENNNFKRQYIKLYLENLTDKQLEKIDGYSGNILEKVLQIEIPDYDKDQVVRKVLKEWGSLQKEISNLEEEIEKTDREIDQMVYDLYDLTDEEIKIVKGGKIHG
jgi:hypothetical protein